MNLPVGPPHSVVAVIGYPLATSGQFLMATVTSLERIGARLARSLWLAALRATGARPSAATHGSGRPWPTASAAARRRQPTPREAGSLGRWEPAGLVAAADARRGNFRQR
jgi:hypothetical protein